MGYVYYGQYPLWFEGGRTELLRLLGFVYRDLEDGGAFLPVRHLAIRYHAPVRYDDRVRIATGVGRIGRASVTFVSAVYHVDGHLCTVGTVELASVDAAGKPQSLAEPLRTALRDVRLAGLP